MSEPILEAVDVVKSLGAGAGRVDALRGVGIALRGGELTLLMGPSGSGKTTLLSILGCILTPTSGTVRVAGLPILPSVSDADGVGQRPSGAGRARRGRAPGRGQGEGSDDDGRSNPIPGNSAGANSSASRSHALSAALDSVNGQIVMKVLADIAKDPARAVLVVAHDPRIIPFANRIIHIEDGRIVDVEPGAAGSNSG